MGIFHVGGKKSWKVFFLVGSDSITSERLLTNEYTEYRIVQYVFLIAILGTSTYLLYSKCHLHVSSYSLYNPFIFFLKAILFFLNKKFTKSWKNIPILHIGIRTFACKSRQPLLLCKCTLSTICSLNKQSWIWTPTGPLKRKRTKQYKTKKAPLTGGLSSLIDINQNVLLFKVY